MAQQGPREGVRKGNISLLNQLPDNTHFWSRLARFITLTCWTWPRDHCLRFGYRNVYGSWSCLYIQTCNSMCVLRHYVPHEMLHSLFRTWMRHLTGLAEMKIWLTGPLSSISSWKRKKTTSRREISPFTTKKTRMWVALIASAKHWCYKYECERGRGEGGSGGRSRFKYIVTELKSLVRNEIVVYIIWDQSLLCIYGCLKFWVIFMLLY